MKNVIRCLPSFNAPHPRSAAGKYRPSIFIACLVVFGLLRFVASSARAQDFWIGGNAANPTWNQGSNWNNGVPFATFDVILQPPIPAIPGPVITLQNGDVANSLVFLQNYTLSGGTLQLSAGNSVFSGIVAVAPGATATINTALVGPNPLIVGTFSPYGGGGTLILNGANTYTGDTFINLGSVFVNGSLVSPHVSVSSGALLAGTGTLFGSVVNAGTVSPGNSTGTLHIGGGYMQAATGLLSIGIASQSSHGLLQIGGSANLSGTLQLVRLNNFDLQPGSKITILTAEQGISGTFGNVIDPYSRGTILDPEVVYTRDSVAIETLSFEQFATNANLTPNEKSVATALDGVVYDRRASSLINYLDNRPLSKLSGDFDRISPDALTSIFTIGTALAQQQSLNLQRRTDDLRSGASGFNAANLAINGNGPSFSGGFDITTGVAGPSGDDGKEVKETKEMKDVAPAEPRWGAFLSGTGEWVSVGDTNNARGYEIANGGFTLGVDYKVCPNFAIGLMAGYTGTSADLTEGGRIFVNGGNLGLYATTFVGGWYADVAASGGYSSYDTRRTALQGDASGSTDGGDLNVLFGTGYDFKAGGFTFGPTGSFNYAYVGTNGFNESGSLAPLSIHGDDVDSLRTAFGLKAAYECKCGGLVFKPELRAAWQHEYGDTAYALDSNLASGAGEAFSVTGPRIGRDSCLLGAGFAIQCSERCSTYFYYDGELGRKNYESNAVTGGFRIAF